VVNAAVLTMADSNPPDARKLADSIDSSSPWQDAKNDTKKPSFSQMADTLNVAIVMLC
jgi:hypothetical protein